MIQSIIFEKNKWSNKTAKKWLRDNMYSPIKPVHATSNFLRFRLHNPELFKSFITKKLPNGIELIIGIV